MVTFKTVASNLTDYTQQLGYYITTLFATICCEASLRNQCTSSNLCDQRALSNPATPGIECAKSVPSGQHKSITTGAEEIRRTSTPWVAYQAKKAEQGIDNMRTCPHAITGARAITGMSLPTHFIFRRK